MNIEVVQKDYPFTLDIHAPKNKHDIMHVYLGVSATATLSECFKTDPVEVKQVRVQCQNF